MPNQNTELSCLDAKKTSNSDVESDAAEETDNENSQKDPNRERTYYDKSASFFDHISCEALEKQEGYAPLKFFKNCS